MCLDVRFYVPLAHPHSYREGSGCEWACQHGLGSRARALHYRSRFVTLFFGVLSALEVDVQAVSSDIALQQERVSITTRSLILSVTKTWEVKSSLTRHLLKLIVNSWGLEWVWVNLDFLSGIRKQPKEEVSGPISCGHPVAMRADVRGQKLWSGVRLLGEQAFRCGYP